MMKSTKAIDLLLGITISLTACTDAETTVQKALSPTAEAASVVTESSQEFPTPTPTFTPTPSAQPTAPNTRVPTVTTTPTSTPEPVPAIKVDETLTTQTNVRAGPGTDYPVITQFEPGQEAPVTGRNEEGSWWQIDLNSGEESDAVGWIFGELVTLAGDESSIPIAQASPPPATPTPTAVAQTESAEGNPPAPAEKNDSEASNDNLTPEELADQLRCGKDFCVTYQAMVPIWENGGCVGNHSIYITVLEGLPPGKPMDGVVIGDTFNNVEVASGSHGPGRTEITLWNNSMTLIAKRHIDDTPYTSEESFNFTAHDELIPAEVLAANGYCDGSVEKCRQAQQNNQVCRGHYSWRVTFHKFD